MNVWMAVWMGIFLVSLFVMERYGDTSLTAAGIGLLITALAAIPAVGAAVRFIRQADELTRLIQLQAMSVAFGAGIVSFVLERFMERVVELSLLPAILLDFVNPWMMMMFTYIVAVALLQRRYSR